MLVLPYVLVQKYCCAAPNFERFDDNAPVSMSDCSLSSHPAVAVLSQIEPTKERKTKNIFQNTTSKARYNLPPGKTGLGVGREDDKNSQTTHTRGGGGVRLMLYLFLLELEPGEELLDVLLLLLLLLLRLLVAGETPYPRDSDFDSPDRAVAVAVAYSNARPPELLGDLL